MKKKKERGKHNDYCTYTLMAHGWKIYMIATSTITFMDNILQILTVPCSNKCWHWLRPSGLLISSKTIFSACICYARSVPSYRCLLRTSSFARFCQEKKTTIETPVETFHPQRIPQKVNKTRSISLIGTVISAELSSWSTF